MIFIKKGTGLSEWKKENSGWKCMLLSEK